MRGAAAAAGGAAFASALSAKRKAYAGEVPLEVTILVRWEGACTSRRDPQPRCGEAATRALDEDVGCAWRGESKAAVGAGAAPIGAAGFLASDSGKVLGRFLASDLLWEGSLCSGKVLGRFLASDSGKVLGRLWEGSLCFPASRDEEEAWGWRIASSACCMPCT